MSRRRTHLVLLAAALTAGGAHGAPQVEPRLVPILAQLGITEEVIARKNLKPVVEARELVIAETGPDGRRHMMTPSAAAAWWDMRLAAAGDGIALNIVSAYRSVDRQIEIVRRKLDSGETLDQILAVSAPPGFSEHHTGKAMDLTTPGSRLLMQEFADTPAYQWLQDNAHRFGFVLSYPEGNPEGYDFEPWHWRWEP